MSKKGFLAIVNNGIEFLIGSILLVLITKFFSMEESGAWIVFLTLSFVATKFREGITQSSLIKFSVGVTKEQKYGVYFWSIALTVGIELLMGLTAYVVAVLFFKDPLGELLANYIWLAVPQSLYRLFQFISQSRLDVKNMIHSNIVLLNIMVMVMLYIILENASFGNLPVLLSVAYWVTLAWQLFMHNVACWAWSKDYLKLPEGYLNYAANGILRELFGTISSRAYILLTAGLVSYEASALVGIASRYANLIYLPNSAYQGLLYPKACKMVNEGSLKKMFGFYRRALSWMQAGFIPYVVLILTAGSTGILLLHGLNYMYSIPFFAVLILAGAFISPYGHAFGSVCQAAGRPDLVTKLVLLNSGLNLILSFLLIKLFGVWGAVLSPIMTDLLGLLFIRLIMDKVFEEELFESVNRLKDRVHILLLINLKFLKNKTKGLSQ